MTPAVLTLNAGSSSLKVALFPQGGDLPMATALADRIGPAATLRLRDAHGGDLAAWGDLTTHAGALGAIIEGFRAAFAGLDLRAIGHRVVHGGANRMQPALVDAALMAELQTLAPLAPLHQPHNLAGIRAAQHAFPQAVQIACFDTAFHRTHPWVSDTYALPRALHAAGLRRYGFHGLSYEYVAGRLCQLAPDLAAGRVVVAHLGNGASMCALRGGRSVASSMGFSPLDGLPMGTRCGQIDPGVLLYLLDQRGMSAAEVSDLLYRQSGLLGLSGLSNDMRVLQQAATPEADQAIEYFVHRCAREVAALAADLGGIDGLVFCGGIGENAPAIRAAICARLGWLGLTADAASNAANAQVISAPGGVVVMVVPTNEELVIARAARHAVGW